eukprot:TRINITY_DN27820_c0_g1_i1.p1 TRINITY_DN27820_c0_g1~~TRINITY_DN27820_c0_g1_i1.p1  ORF type:complete len:107 (+),score=16.70 TRINITY_DN27820_c0_g1_i1:37-321(+)
MSHTTSTTSLLDVAQPLLSAYAPAEGDPAHVYRTYTSKVFRRFQLTLQLTVALLRLHFITQAEIQQVVAHSTIDEFIVFLQRKDQEGSMSDNCD